ncbi:peroxin, partial [Cladochytrium tenue]
MVQHPRALVAGYLSWAVRFNVVGCVVNLGDLVIRDVTWAMNIARQVGTVVVGVAGSLYALYKYSEIKWREMEARRELERAAKANLKLRFEQNQRDCSYTVLRLLPTIVFQIYPALDVESVTTALQQQRAAKTAQGAAESPDAAKRRKLELWAELKSLSNHGLDTGAIYLTLSDSLGFTRTVSALYLVTLLTVFTHLQLNLLGRYIYLDSVAAQTAARQLDGRFADEDSNPDDGGDDALFDEAAGGAPRRALPPDAERLYLTFSWQLLN